MSDSDLVSDLVRDLESEREFWESMISVCVLEPNSEDVARMKEALAFAEFRLEGVINNK